MYCLLNEERRGRNSAKLPGQPWTLMMGTAEGFLEKRAVKWTWKLSFLSSREAMKLGKEFMFASQARLGGD